MESPNWTGWRVLHTLRALAIVPFPSAPSSVLDEYLSRRSFLASTGSIGALWLLADVADREDAARHAQQQMAVQQPTLAFFSREQAAEVDAMISRIIPVNDTPGARELGVLYFIDRAVTTWAKDVQPAFTAGLQQLAKDVAAKYPGETRLAGLAPLQQDEVLKSIEQSEFFGLVRFATIAGVFSIPSYGGNRDWLGWKMLGQEPAMDHRPPFGWYDRPANRRTLLGGDA